MILLTGNHSIQEKTMGFQLGIEDFVAKPFDPFEFRLRVESRLRKLEEYRRVSDSLKLGNLQIHLSSQRAELYEKEGSRAIELSQIEAVTNSVYRVSIEAVSTRAKAA